MLHLGQISKIFFFQLRAIEHGRRQEGNLAKGLSGTTALLCFETHYGGINYLPASLLIANLYCCLLHQRGFSVTDHRLTHIHGDNSGQLPPVPHQADLLIGNSGLTSTEPTTTPPHEPTGRGCLAIADTEADTKIGKSRYRVRS